MQEDGVLELPRTFYDEMIAHAREDDPDECCGVLAGADGRVSRLYRMTNEEHSPYRYSIDTKKLYQVMREMWDQGSDLMAIYHSHTHSEARPSATDIRLVTYPDAYYILVSLMDKASPSVRAFFILDGAADEQGLSVVEG